MSEQILIYGGTSGWSGSETSKARATTSDRKGLTGKTQNAVLDFVSAAGSEGVTWHEVADYLNVHHGTASGALSILHKVGQLCRLEEVRNRSKVYVAPQHRAGRNIEQHGRKSKSCHHCGGVL